MKNIKNIVWILTDSQHAEAVGYMGNKAVHTPNLDKLAAKRDPHPLVYRVRWRTVPKAHRPSYERKSNYA